MNVKIKPETLFFARSLNLAFGFVSLSPLVPPAQAPQTSLGSVISPAMAVAAAVAGEAR